MYPETSCMLRKRSSAFSRRCSLSLIVLLLTLLRGSAAVGQTVPQPTEQPKPVPGIGTTVQDDSSPPAQGRPAPATEPQKPISKAEAKELFRSVDEILQFVSRDTGLPIKHKVKRKLITRQQVERYVEKRLKDDKDTQRLERSQLVLKKFGMIPENYDLHTAFLKLLSEQVAAYYDSRTKTVNLLDWVQPELQKPVLAHELTHALQDQAVDLEKWGLAGGSNNGPLPDQQEQVVEEAQAARQNVTEGQAMVAMLDYTLAPAGVNVITAPDVVNAMRAGMRDGKDLPVLGASPVFLQESLMMPYTFGLDFVREVLTKKGKNAAFAGMLEHPPIDTYQIMDPPSYMTGQPVEPLTIPDLGNLVAPDYQRYDFGGMGAFDIYLLVKQYDPGSDTKQYYSHWRGGYYLAVHPKAAPKDQIALIYFSRWDSPVAAAAFERLYSSYVPARYHIGALGSMGAGSPIDPGIEWDLGAQGKVLLETHGNDLLIMEGLDDATMDRLRAALLPGLIRPQASQLKPVVILPGDSRQTRMKTR